MFLASLIMNNLFTFNFNMRKVCGYIVLAICILIYVVSSYQKLTKRISHYKMTHNSIWGSDRMRYGDLYGLAYLPYFRKNYVNQDSAKLAGCDQSPKINLYEICDSYLWEFLNKEKFYCGVNKLTYATTNDKNKLTAQLDSSKINVLLLEMSERNIRRILYDSAYVANMIITKPGKPINTGKTVLAKSSGSSKWESRISKITDVVFNKSINANIEDNIWDIALFTPIKELKAIINYKLLGRINDDVKLSSDKKQLFYSMTIDADKNTSSFKPVTDAELKLIVNRINLIYANSKKAGFKKTYLSIIPNPVSVIEPDYNGLSNNNLVDRIQNSPDLQMPKIDLLPAFKNAKQRVYAASDTHWNWTGAQLWLNLFNKELSNTVKESEQKANSGNL